MNIDDGLKWATPVLLALIFALGTGVARADEHTDPDTGQWYFGGGIAYNELDECKQVRVRGPKGRRTVEKCSGESELGHTLVFGKDKLVELADFANIGFEFGYADLGESVDTELDAVFLTPFMRVPIGGGYNVFLRAGPVYIDGDKDDWSEMVGIGAEKQWEHAFARLGWDLYPDLKNDQDVDSFSVLVGYRW